MDIYMRLSKPPIKEEPDTEPPPNGVVSATITRVHDTDTYDDDTNQGFSPTEDLEDEGLEDRVAAVFDPYDSTEDTRETVKAIAAQCRHIYKEQWPDFLPIRLWAACPRGKIFAIHSIINKALHSPQRYKSDTELRWYLEYFQYCLTKQAPLERPKTVWHAGHAGMVAPTEGTQIRQARLTACCTTQSACMDCFFEPGEAIYEIHDAVGYNLAEVSGKPEEKEFLIPDGSWFVVKEISHHVTHRGEPYDRVVLRMIGLDEQDTGRVGLDTETDKDSAGHTDWGEQEQTTTQVDAQTQTECLLQNPPPLGYHDADDDDDDDDDENKEEREGIIQLPSTTTVATAVQNHPPLVGHHGDDDDDENKEESEEGTIHCTLQMHKRAAADDVKVAAATQVPSSEGDTTCTHDQQMDVLVQRFTDLQLVVKGMEDELQQLFEQIQHQAANTAAMHNKLGCMQQFINHLKDSNLDLETALLCGQDLHQQWMDFVVQVQLLTDDLQEGGGTFPKTEQNENQSNLQQGYHERDKREKQLFQAVVTWLKGVFERDKRMQRQLWAAQQHIQVLYQNLDAAEAEFKQIRLPELEARLRDWAVHGQEQIEKLTTMVQHSRNAAAGACPG
eukprot:TRINITY_DN66613_c4_g1_i1.p1 TRINITY_DN66613_c4_g1~~TRINITY_DN66613_c4_g1_i1.p1  ORF type:complete len:615 (+),score=73.70 TRINITY_DN66613_c4_g1_i1:76-1920(+)